MNKKANNPHYLFETKKNFESKSSSSSVISKKLQTSKNELTTLSKFESKKLEPSGISSSLSLKKQKNKQLNIDLKVEKESKVNPESKISEKILNKASSTERFMVRNAFYNKQKTLKLENQRRKHLYGIAADCKFAPQIQKSTIIEVPPKLNANSQISIHEEQKTQNMGKYQYNYRKKIEYEQFGYSKKNISKGVNKSVKELLKESVQRFNLKVKKQQSSENEPQQPPVKRKLFTQDIHVSDTIDTHKNLIWITNESDKKSIEVQKQDNLLQVQIEPLDNDAQANLEKQLSMSRSLINCSLGSMNEQSNQLQVQLLQETKQIQQKNQHIQDVIDKKDELNNINDISDILKAQQSLNQSDFFNSQLRNKELDLGRDSGEDWFPKCFKKEMCKSCKGQEESQKCTQNEEKTHKVIPDSNSLIVQSSTSVVQQSVVQQVKNVGLCQIVEDRQEQQQEIQSKQIRKSLPQQKNQVIQIDNQKEMSLAFDVYQQQKMLFQTLNFNYSQIQHFFIGNLSLQPRNETKTHIKDQQEQIQMKSLTLIAQKEVQQNEQDKHQPQQDQIQQVLKQVKEQPLKYEEQRQFLQEQHFPKRKEETQSYIIDDFGNVILKDNIQIYTVGLCKILVIPELPEEEARTSYS